MSDLHEDRRWLHARDRAKTRGMTTPEWIKEHGPHPSWRGLYRNSDQAIAAYQEWKVRYFRNCAMKPDYAKTEERLTATVIVKGRQAGVRTMCVDLETNPSCYEFVGAAAVAKMTERLNGLIFDDLNLCGATTSRMSSTTPNLQSLPKAASNHIMNKTSTDLRAELAAAEAAEATAAEVAARQAKLDGYRKLAQATTLLLGRISERSTIPSNLLAEHRFELKALAAEFDSRIVLIGDRTQAVLVQA